MQEVAFKGKKIRSAVSSPKETRGSVVMIFRADKDRVYTIFDQQKKYIEFSRKMIEDQLTNVPKDHTPATVTRTGKTQKLLGYNCEQILLTQGETTIELWGTSELPQLRKAMESLNSFQKHNIPQWSKEVEKLRLFPMKTIMNIKGSRAETTVTSIQKKSLPEPMFNIPAGYTKQQLPVGQPGMKKP